jgi:hypothetical protein
MIIIKIKVIFYIITPSYMFQLPLSEPWFESLGYGVRTRVSKHVAGSNNVKYIFNFNDNYHLSCIRLYIL